MGFLKFLRNLGGPDGTREAFRISYKKHLRLASSGKVSPELGSPHEVGLYGALASRYKTRLSLPPEPAIWAELSPFLLMEPSTAVEALAEYIVSEEWGPDHANVEWLQKVISDALRPPPASPDSFRCAAPLAVASGVTWCFLLDEDVGQILSEEAAKLEKQDTSGESAPRSPQGQDSDELVNLVVQATVLEERCAKVWDESIRQRRQYRELRRTDAMAARKMVDEGQSGLPDDETLIAELDRFFDSLCGMYLGAELEGRVEIRNLFEGNKRLLGNLLNYAGRSAIKLRETGTPEFLLRGLAAASIDGGRSCQEYGFEFGQLYRNALDHGLEPSQCFSVVAKLSDNEMRAVLENFEASEDFAVFVRPYIEGKKLT